MALDLPHEKYETRMKNTVLKKHMRDVSFFMIFGGIVAKNWKISELFQWIHRDEMENRE